MNAFEELTNEFVARTSRAHGHLARPNDTHYAAALVTESVQWLRSQVSRGHQLNEDGERFVAGAAAYLGYLTFLSFEKRRFEITLSASWEPGDRHLALFALRHRDGQEETYGHDFFADVNDLLLRPPQTFPVFRGYSYILSSLSLPTPEYLYLSGVQFLHSPCGVGNWGAGEPALSDDADFDAARELLIDDLHVDTGLPVDDPELRQLSNWVVWPIYGWEQNEGQEYNLMTLIDQIVFRDEIEEAKGVNYLRSLLASQAFHLRNLAARTLIILGVTPSNPVETRIYQHALHASDQPLADPGMVRFQWLVDGGSSKAPIPEDFADAARARWWDVAHQGPREPWLLAPILTDPLYERFGNTEVGRSQDRLDLARALHEKYPDDWHARVAYGHSLLVGPSPEHGEAILQEATRRSPGDPNAHFSLGSYLANKGELEAARELYEDAVELCPWNPHAVANAMWALTSGMVTANPQLQV